MTKFGELISKNQDIVKFSHFSSTKKEGLTAGSDKKKNEMPKKKKRRRTNSLGKGENSHAVPVTTL